MLLNDVENKKANDFMMAHYEKHKKTAEVILTATATGIGFGIKVQCPYCRKSEDISDYDSW